MIVMSPLEIKKQCIILETTSFISTRAITKEYNSLFSIHDTTIYEGQVLEICYQRHEEYVYVISGEGEIYNYDTQEAFKLEPNTIYHVNKNDKHRLTAKTDMRGICIFTPSCYGNEQHDENGSY